MSAKNVLVTGGAGYIGSHACKALAQAGYSPITYDNMAYGHEWAVKWGPLEKGDISDLNRLNEVLLTYKPATVMHFAAFAYVGDSIKNPLKYYRNNVAGTLTLLQAMREHNIEQMVFSSTCATYGLPQQIPTSEDFPQNPINPYGASKLMVEQVLNDCGSAYGLRSIALRYFNAAGADPDCEIGENHDPETHLIPLVLKAAESGRGSEESGNQPLAIFGTDYPTPDGTCIRDYIHVTDLAQAHILALNELENSTATSNQQPDPAFKAYNLGNGKGFSVKEVIEVAERVTGKDIPFQIGERRVGDPAVLVGDAGRIREELGWQPRFDELETIIETAWKWQEKQPVERLDCADAR